MAPAHLCSPQDCQSCAGFPAGMLDPPPPAVDKKCWEKRLSQDMSCSLFLILPTPPSAGHPVTWVLKYLSLSAKTCFEGAPVTTKHCLIHPAKREKYLEQSLNAIKSLRRWELIFQLSSAQLNSAAGAVSSSQKRCNSRGSPREADLHRRQCKGFSCKTKYVLSNEHSWVQGEDWCQRSPRRSVHRLCMRTEKICKDCATPVAAQEAFGQVNIKTRTSMCFYCNSYVSICPTAIWAMKCCLSVLLSRFFCKESRSVCSDTAVQQQAWGMWLVPHFCLKYSLADISTGKSFPPYINICEQRCPEDWFGTCTSPWFFFLKSQ